MSEVQKRTVRETEYVHEYVSFKDKVTRMPVEEIEHMKYVVGEKLVDNVVSVAGLSKGRKVELPREKLTRLKGTELWQSGKYYFLIEIKSIRYAIRIQADADHLRYVA